MKRSFLTSLVLMVCMGMSAQRQISDFNFGWKFHLGEYPVEQLQNAFTDDSDWRDIDVPHDFQIEQPWVAPSADENANNSDGASNFKSRLSARAFKEMGSGWYVKKYVPEMSLKNKRTIIDFEGIMYVGDVYLNGERIGGTDYGYLGFEIDLSNKLKYGEENIIAVRANTSNPLNSRWYTGGGLFRDVHIITTDPQLYFARHPLYITTSENKFINIQAEVTNYTRDSEMSLLVRIKDNENTVIYEKAEKVAFNRKSRSNEIKLPAIQLPAPHLWSCEDPYLYTAEVQLTDKNGQVRDVASSRFVVSGR